ncbi:dihydrofolate reductase family protein [Streptomyces sp. NPDC059166]|uniref:dihydrofolate reductase family protein n=1 Tax=Streptomyces sp. NPDC059166 TaxID=3346752 RepID=UPI00369C51DC
MTSRPYVVLSAAMSVDGHLDDAGDRRLMLSNAEDFDRVDEVRAGADAILVGASTLRRDNPRLLVNSEQRRTARVARGLPAHPLKVTVTASGRIDPDLRFWRHGDRKLVLTVDGSLAEVRRKLDGLAEVVSVGPEFDWGRALDELGRRRVERLLVEGGGTVHTQLMEQDLADELHLVVAPLLVGQAGAPKFLGPAHYPGGPTARMRLVETRAIGDVVLLHYAPKQRQRAGGPDRDLDLHWMRRAIELAAKCPPSEGAYSVGAVIVGSDGTELSHGYSREADPHVHAEESALAKLPPGDPRLRTATIYTSLEPCSQRRSRPHPCARLILAAGLPRVVTAWREPSLFVDDCVGVEQLRAAGVTVVELPELAEEAESVNAHLFGTG